MKKIVLLLILGSLFIPCVQEADASLISDRAYRAEVRKENRQELKEIKKLFKIHNEFANKHDIKGLEALYSETT